MADNKKYYYMRLKEDFFDSDEMILLETLPDGMIYQNILLKMYCRSLKSEGRLMLNNIIPYSTQVLANVTRQQIGTVEKALDIFQQIGLIEILDNGAIYMMNLQEYIGSSSTEADRKREYRNAIQEEKEQADKCPTNVRQISTITRDRDKTINKAITKDKAEEENRASAEVPDDKCPYKQIMKLYQEICVSYPHIRTITGERQKAVKARWKENPNLDTFKELFEIAESSSFMKGNNDRNWKADFDFMMNPNKFNNILEGKYNKGESKPETPEKSDLEQFMARVNAKLKEEKNK